MNGNIWYVLLSFIPALINLGIIFYLIFYLPRTKTLNIFTFFVIALILWQAQDTILRICQLKETARFWYSVLCIGWMSVGSLSFHFAARYAEIKKLYSSIVLVAIYLPFFVFEILSHSVNDPLIFIHNPQWGWIDVPRRGTFDSLQRYWISVQVMGTLFILFRQAIKTKDNKRKFQAFFIAIGMLIPALQGILTQVLFPLVISKEEVPVTSTFLTFFSLATIIAVSKYKLFNISESVRSYKVLENLTNKVLVVSGQKKIVYINPHASGIFGIGNESVLVSLEKIFPDKNIYEKFCTEVFDKALNSKTIINYETTFLTKSKKKIDVMVSSQLLKNNNIIEGVLLVAHDISARIKAVKALEISNERYNYATRAAFDAIWDWDVKTRQLYLGDAYSELFGYKIQNNVTDFSKWASHIHPEDRERVIFSRLNKIIRNDESSWQDEYRYLRKDGSICFISDRGILLRNSNSTYRMIGAMQDITERKMAEEKIMQEKNVKQKEITEAVITAQESERSEIGKELHDNINQLLGASRLYIETARTDRERSESLLATASSYTLSAIEEIRKLSKRLISPSINESGLFDAVNNLTENIMAVHSVEINFYTNDVDENLFNEKFKLNIFRIIQEQLNNILKYAKAKTVEINFKETDTELFFSVSDDGVGFDTSKWRNGVGISNINSRAELYKGRVIIASRPGEGCVLAITFIKSELLFTNADTLEVTHA